MSRSWVAHFQLKERLGIGAFGSVWKAWDSKLDRLVALKIPNKDRLSVSEREIFHREARAAAQLNHPNIVRVFETGEDQGVIFIASEYIEGVTLRDYAAANDLTIQQVVEICRKLASALAAAHEAFVIHRDLKPANILIDDEREPHVTDFGLAKRETGEITMTVEGAVMGTFAYMSPEQAQGRSHYVDGRCDQFSLGIILYELLSKQRPFDGGYLSLVQQITSVEPVPPSLHCEKVSRDLETICLKCLQKNPGDRYATCRELESDLSRFLNGEAILARPLNVYERSVRYVQKRWKLLSALAFGIAMIGLAMSVWFAGQSNLELSQVERAVHNVLTAESVEFADELSILKPMRDAAIPLIKARADHIEAKPRERLRSLMALIALEESEVTSVLEFSIENDVPGDECQNIIDTLSINRSPSLRALDDRFMLCDKNSDHQAASRLASLALGLGDCQYVDALVEMRRDMAKRTVFVHTFQTWHGRLSAVSSVIADSDNEDRQGSLLLGVGSISRERVAPDVVAALHRTAREMYANAQSSWARACADWFLRKWGLNDQSIRSETIPNESRNWYANSLGMTLVEIPRGNVARQLGKSAESSADDITEIKMARPFYISDREVSVEQFMAFLNERSNSNTDVEWSHLDPKISPTPKHPVQGVNVFDAVRFCNWLSMREGLARSYKIEKDGIVFRPHANGYRLPTEQEWEYACRATTITDFSSGNDEHLLAQYANFGTGSSMPCGSLMPNPWGLFDMHGNIWEWCWGRFEDPDWLGSSESMRVPDDWVVAFRGGGWSHSAATTASSARFFGNPMFRPNGNGFRVARNKTSDVSALEPQQNQGQR
ncbi:MAG: SUMF1/EgtB/PvdO family nonheme iron enzyme [Planctomycetaceae bacterium]|nr:SUMF1/EgtB/PvdO family nonheme iron enzyme [Planctomycetaceae bacterium]